MPRQLQLFLPPILILATALAMSTGMSLGAGFSAATTAKEPEKSVRSNEKNDKATVYEQDSKVLGHCQLFVAKSGIRLNWQRKKISLIAHPPEWRMTMLNTATNKYFISPRDHFRACTLMTVTLYRTSDTSILKPKTRKSSTLMGLNVDKISMSGEPALKPGDRRWQRLLLHSAEYWVQPTTTVPAAVVRHIQEMYVLPAADGLPLQLITVSNKNKRENELVLTKVTTQTVTAKDFSIPAQYSPVKKQEELLSDEQNTEFMELMP